MSLSAIPVEVYEETLKDMRQRVFRAILTCGAQPPVVSLSYPREWGLGTIVRDAHDAYGYTPSKRRFIPSPKDVSDMLPVMGAVARYKYHAINGERDFKIIFARAYDQPWWRIAEMIGTSERSLIRWQDRAVEEILTKHLTALSDAGHVSAQQSRTVA